MANDLSALAPKLLAQGLLALRNTNVMPAIVNSDYSDEFAEKGTTVDIPVPAAIAVQNVAPSNTPPSTTDITPTTVPLTLDKWKEAPFYLTDKDMKQAMNGVIPMQASEAIAALADQINADIFLNYKGVYGIAGVDGTTPFASNTSEATDARKVLNKQKCPLNDRRFVLDPDAEANALNLRAFQDASFAASPSVIQEGNITRKLGFDWFMDQQVPTHTVGTLSNGSNNQGLIDDASVTVGQKTIDIDDTSLTGTVVEGDIFTVAGDTQTYVVTNGPLTASGNAVTGIAFEPGAKVAWADDAVITFRDSHVVNLAFNRLAIAFASRPLQDTAGLGNVIQTASDPVSRITLRLEISREHKRTRFSYDILYGSKLVRRELITRLAG